MRISEIDFEENYELLNLPFNIDEVYYINTSTGYLCNSKTMKRLGSINRKGYVNSTLKICGSYSSVYNHIINFLHFHKLKSIQMGFEIDHADHNRSNNNIDNLRLSSIAQNRKDRVFKKRGKNPNYGKRVRSINLDKNSKSMIFDSMSKCAKYYEKNVGIVSAILNKVQYYSRTLCNDNCYYTFVYMDDDNKVFIQPSNELIEIDNELINIDVDSDNEYNYDLIDSDSDDDEILTNNGKSGSKCCNC
jgi:hypothetical protein